MSITVDYYFNSDASLSELAERLNGILGCRFEPYEGDDFDLSCRLLSVELSLCECRLEDDGVLNFSAYRYELGSRTAVPDGDLRGIQLGLMALVPSLLQRRAGIAGGMLVYDVQRLLARYEMYGDLFFDTVSGEPVSFPSHFLHVCGRT